MRAHALRDERDADSHSVPRFLSFEAQVGGVAVDVWYNGQQ